MKRIYIVFTLFFAQLIGAQWINNPSPTISTINSIYFNKQHVGFFTTNNKIFNSIDMGNSWTPIEIGSNYNLYNITFVDSLLGFIVGSKDGNGIVIRTSDGGNNWNIISVGFANVFFDVSFVSSKNGWIFGEVGSLVGKIGKTIDGGSTWIDQHVDSYGPILSGFFIDTLNGWAAGENRCLIKTTNGGSSWFSIDTLYIRSDSVVPLRSIYFIDKKTGWVVGGIAEYNAILKTTDGGKTWSHRIFKPQFPQPDLGVARLNDIFFLNQEIGYIVGREISPGNFYELILKSTDGGVSWIKQDKHIASELNCVFFLNDTLGWASGINGTLLRTTNGGVSFVDENIKPIQTFSLSQNFPNPFNPTTIIQFELPHSQFVTLKVFDILGREVNTLINEILYRGVHSLTFDAQKYNLASGIYFYQLFTEGFSKTKSMVLSK